MAETRMIRRSLVDSERFNGLGWLEQNLFFRLMLVADDFGLFDARPAYLRAQLYGMCLDRVREADLQRGLAACEEAGLVRLYAVAGKPYLMIERYGQRGKGRPKFPLPPGLELVPVRAGRSTEWAVVPVADGADAAAGVAAEPAAGRCGSLRAAADDGGARRGAALVGVEDGDVYGVEERVDMAMGSSSPSLPPPLAEVTRAMGALMLAPLAEERALAECATRFVDDCSAAGWCDRRGLPMRDWRAAARNYARRYAERLAQGRGGKANVQRRKDCNDADDYR